METPEAIEIARQGIYVLLRMALPLMFTALVVGLAISLFQALTQIQEMTLSFVPKIMAIFILLIFVLPIMHDTLAAFTVSLFDRIAQQ